MIFRYLPDNSLCYTIQSEEPAVEFPFGSSAPITSACSAEAPPWAGFPECWISQAGNIIMMNGYWRRLKRPNREWTTWKLESRYVKNVYHLPCCSQTNAYLKCCVCQHVRPRLVMNIKRNPFNCAHLVLMTSSAKRPAALRCHQTLQAANKCSTKFSTVSVEHGQFDGYLMDIPTGKKLRQPPEALNLGSRSTSSLWFSMVAHHSSRHGHPPHADKEDGLKT